MSLLLLADDSITTQKIVELSLKESNIRVLSCADGRTALEHALQQAPDLVLANVRLPLLDGYELCRRLKSLSSTREVPVILMTGSLDQFDAEQARAAGYHGHLAKPFPTAQLISLVHGVLGSYRFERELKRQRIVFEVPLTPAADFAAFELTPRQCEPTFELLAREVSPCCEIPPRVQKAAVTPEPTGDSLVSEEELSRIILQVVQRLDEEIRRLVPKLAREILKEHLPTSTSGLH
ncbi:MAG: response regulator [Acidobacteria bacterium]|nr:response regulator [Acidobacteriota bacterium]